MVISYPNLLSCDCRCDHKLARVDTGLKHRLGYRDVNFRQLFQLVPCVKLGLVFEPRDCYLNLCLVLCRIHFLSSIYLDSVIRRAVASYDLGNLDDEHGSFASSSCYHSCASSTRGYHSSSSTRDDRSTSRTPGNDCGSSDN